MTAQDISDMWKEITKMDTKIAGEYKPNLKPCPFCGSPAEHGKKIEYNNYGADDHYVTIGCGSCDFYFTRWIDGDIDGLTLCKNLTKPPGQPGSIYSFWTNLSEVEKEKWKKDAEEINTRNYIAEVEVLASDWNRRTEN